MYKTWCFNPADTLFFRGGKPFEAGESGWLESFFPPSPHTIQGIIRTRILSEFTNNFEYNNDGTWRCAVGNLDLSAEIGKAGQSENLGKLKLSGPFLTYHGERLYPLPLDIVHNKAGLTSLTPSSESIECDLGKVRLPATDRLGVKNFSEVYINGDDLIKALLGVPLSGAKLYYLFPPEGKEEASLNILADRESRIGLARDNAQRTCLEGHLYAVSLIRPRENVGVEVDISGIDDKLQELGTTIQRIGGEGKLSEISIKNELPPQIVIPDLAAKIDENKGCFKLVFVTPARFKGNGWLFDGFVKNANDGWQGTLEGLTCRLISACVGKAQKTGGWNMAEGKKCPKDLAAYVPAGSVYFLQADIKGVDIIKGLQTGQIGEEKPLGFGQFFIGTWEDKRL